jgi:hypothetical protein
MTHHLQAILQLRGVESAFGFRSGCEYSVTAMCTDSYLGDVGTWELVVAGQTDPTVSLISACYLAKSLVF